MIQGLCVNFDSTKAAGVSPATSNIFMPVKPTIPIEPTTAPEYLKDIKPWSYQVWNCDKIGFDPNG